jgi:hypothetical protein
MLTTIRTLIARALVRLAVAAAPGPQGTAIATATRPIWRPGDR